MTNFVLSSRSSRLLLIGLVGVSILIASLVWYEHRTRTSETEVSYTGTLEDLLTLNRPLVCVSHRESGFGYTDTTYVADGMWRTDEVSNDTATNPPAPRTVILFDGVSLYEWSDGNTRGYKNEHPDRNRSSISYQYSCQDWEKDVSYFVPPATISFSPSQGL